MRKLIYQILHFGNRCIRFINGWLLKSSLGYCGSNVTIRMSSLDGCLRNVYLYDNTNILDHFNLISVTGKFIMRENSGAAEGLTVITGNHHIVPGMSLKENILHRVGDIEQDIIVEDNVWIGANVILMDGCHIGRGCIIGAGAVVRSKIPSYSIVVGNPAKIVGFVFTPQQVREHEEKLYKEDERIDLVKYEKNYNKYFINRAQEIKNFLNK